MSKPTLPPGRRMAADDRDLERRIRTLETRVAGITTGDTAWTYPTLAANWTQASTNKVRFRKDANGFVHIMGGATYGSGATFTGALFTLPAGYRPLGPAAGAVEYSKFPVWMLVASVADIHIVSIDSAGAVKPDAIGNSGDIIEFGGLTFYAEN